LIADNTFRMSTENAEEPVGKRLKTGAENEIKTNII
jgi:hypothetical protein